MLTLWSTFLGECVVAQSPVEASRIRVQLGMRGQGSPQCSALLWGSIFTTSVCDCLVFTSSTRFNLQCVQDALNQRTFKHLQDARYNFAIPKMVGKVQCTSRPRCSTWEWWWWWWWGSRVPARVDGNMQQRQVGREAASQGNCKSKLAEIRLTVQQKVISANKKKVVCALPKKNYTLGVNRTEDMI